MGTVRAVRLSPTRGRTATLVCGRGLRPLPALAPALFAGADAACLVADRRCLAVFGRAFSALLEGFRGRVVVFPAPPVLRAKSFETLERLLSFMLRLGCSRRSVVVGAGGGSVTDLAGLGAALYMRGVDWVSVPTTLLGQVDAGIGGKTAVDLGGVKNAAGAFHQPALTACDTSFLDALDGEELRSGAGELIKSALVAGGRTARVIAEGLPGALSRDREALSAVVAACAAFKLGLVARDERDERGLRERLNLGHTAGHAFEALARGRLRHGDAVFWGLRYAARLSLEMGVMDRRRAGAVEALLRLARPAPLAPACRDFDRFLRLVRLDKKRGGRRNRFLLIARPGRVVAVDDVPERTLERILGGLERS